MHIKGRTLPTLCTTTNEFKRKLEEKQAWGAFVCYLLASGRFIQNTKPVHEETSRRTFYRNLLKPKLLSDVFAINLLIFHILLWH